MASWPPVDQPIELLLDEIVELVLGGLGTREQAAYEVLRWWSAFPPSVIDRVELWLHNHLNSEQVK